MKRYFRIGSFVVLLVAIAIFSEAISELLISNYHNSLENYRSILDAIAINIPV